MNKYCSNSKATDYILNKVVQTLDLRLKKY